MKSGVNDRDEGERDAAMLGFLAWWCGNGGFRGVLGPTQEGLNECFRRVKEVYELGL